MVHIQVDCLFFVLKDLKISDSEAREILKAASHNCRPPDSTSGGRSIVDGNFSS